MNQHLVTAEAALKAGQGDEAIRHVLAALGEDEAQGPRVYRALVVQLYNLQRYDEALAWAVKSTERFPKEVEFWNLRGVLLRKLGRYTEALEALDRAAKVNPSHAAPQVNRGNVLLDMGQFAKAEAVFAKLVRQEPRTAEYQRQLARALSGQGKRDAAMMRWRQAVTLKRDFIDAWLDMAGVWNELNRREDAEAVLDKALEANPGHPRVLEAKTIVLRRAGQLRAAEAFLQGLMPDHGQEAWLQYQLGCVVSEYDRDRGNTYLRRSIELDPENLTNVVALAESLNRTRTGDEGQNIEEAYQLAIRALDLGVTGESHSKVLAEIFTRVGDYERLARIGTMKDLGRVWAGSGRHTALLQQMARVRTTEDKLELVEQHRIWGRDVEKRARNMPIKRPPARPPGGKIRIGFMSSDLRQHPVAYFALPLFDHVDRSRFEVFCYSYYQGQEDPVQKVIADAVDGFRWWPDISTRDAAQAIADDQLDILFELGGSTHMNKLEVMAYRPAPKLASWLGYPHSAGLDVIDYFVCDPYSTPTRADLLIEKPLVMPHTWLALSRMFSDAHEIQPGLPEERVGRLTFGTANNPHKYNPPVFELWSRVLKEVPDSRFVFVRPEGTSESFVRNMRGQFEANGVAGDRIEFRPVRGKHMPFYNELDITLDPFPLTGGTTTTESLWMGVPLVSLIGEAFYERLSYSILSNAGVGDLAADTKDGYVQKAVALAADRERRRELRANLRGMMKAGPLGQSEQFAADFYDMVATALA